MHEIKKISRRLYKIYKVKGNNSATKVQKRVLKELYYNLWCLRVFVAERLQINEDLSVSGGK
jgi:hypothetical protein